MQVSRICALVAFVLAAAPASADTVSPAVPRLAMETAWVVFDEIAQVERLVSAGHRSVPGTVVPAGARAQLHTGRFRYEGSEPAAALRVDVAVPPGEAYLAGSATGPGAVISASVDGGQTFFPAAELRPDEPVRLLRFELAGPFLPGTAGLVSFRTVGVEDHAEVTP